MIWLVSSVLVDYVATLKLRPGLSFFYHATKSTKSFAANPDGFFVEIPKSVVLNA